MCCYSTLTLMEWGLARLDPVSCTTAHVLLWKRMRFNLDSVQEDTLRLGIILVAAGVLNAFFEGGDTLTGITVILVGLLGFVVDNLER